LSPKFQQSEAIEELSTMDLKAGNEDEFKEDGNGPIAPDILNLLDILDLHELDEVRQIFALSKKQWNHCQTRDDCQEELDHASGIGLE